MENGVLVRIRKVLNCCSALVEVQPQEEDIIHEVFGPACTVLIYQAFLNAGYCKKLIERATVLYNA